MAIIIYYPFDINYKDVSKALAKYGIEKVKDSLMEQGCTELVADVIIKQALKRGWGN